MAQNDEDAPQPARPASSGAAPRRPVQPAAPGAAPRPASAPRPAAAARPASSAGAAPAGAAPVKRVARPATAAAKPAKVDHHEEHEEQRRRIVAAKEGLDPVTKYGMIGAGALAIIVAIAVFVIKGKKDEERQQFEAYERRVSEIHKKLTDLDVNKLGDATQAIELAESTRKDWQDHEKGRDIDLLLVRAKGKIEADKEQRATKDRFTEIEKKLGDGASLTPEAVKDLRRQLEELEVKLSTIGPEMLARYQIARGSADRTYAQRLVDDAIAFSAANAGENQRLALQRFQTAEDELKALVDRAYNDKNKELQDFYSPLYKQAIEESDKLVSTLFTPMAIERIQPVDCLAGGKIGEWNPSQAKGFSHRIDKGTLQIVGPDADAGRNAVISIGDREQWRNFVLDVEFQVDAGNVEMYFRLGKNPNLNTPQYILKTTGDLAEIRTGRSYRARISIIGSKFIVKFADDQADPPDTKDEDLTWVRSRKGAIGLLIPPGARLKFTKFLVRELR
jgi:hypothetical protein